MIGIKELAENLGISIGTVSRALNNKPDVNAKTRALVLEAAEKKGYVPNQSGQSLRKGTTNAIGLLVSQRTSQSGTDDDQTLLRLTDEIQGSLALHHLDLFVLPCPKQELPFDFLKRIIARRMVDGYIFKGFDLSGEQREFLAKVELPFVEISVSGPTEATIPVSIEHLLSQIDERTFERSREKIKRKAKRP